MRINDILVEFAASGGGDSGNYFQALASAWYNGTFDTGSLQKGIKSQQDVERLLNRGIVAPDGKMRKYHIDYNADFDGVEIYSDDYYEYGDHDDTIDSRTGQKWGPYDFMAFSDNQLDEASREMTNTPRDRLISRMTPGMDANELRQKVAKIVNSPGFTEDTILQIVDAGDNLSHPAGRYIQQAFYGLQYNLGKEYEDYPERVAEKLLSQFRSMLPAYRVTEADEWEEDTEKRERFLQYAKQKLMASNGNIEMALALSQQDNKIFGSPFLNDPAAQQAPAGAVSIIDNRPYTRAIEQIMAYIESKQGQAEISATQAALWLTPQGKKFLERVSTDLYGIDDNAARKKHAIALSGYQVQHLGGKITGSYYGPDDFHSAEQNMTKEVAAIYDLVTLELEREAGIEGDARERQKDMAFWNAIPYPLKVVMCASLGKTPGQMESILFGTEADMLASHFGNKKPKPNADPTPAEPKKLGETGIGRAVNDKGLTQQRWLQLVQTKFPDAKIVQAKMIDGPSRATLPDGRTLSWTKVEQGMAEGLNEFAPDGFNGGNDDDGNDSEYMRGYKDGYGYPKVVKSSKGKEIWMHVTPKNAPLTDRYLQGWNDAKYGSSPNQDLINLDKLGEQGVAEGNKKSEPPEADYGADYQDMVSRVKKLAGLGPLKTVYDPAKRVYKNVPTAVQPKKEQR